MIPTDTPQGTRSCTAPSSRGEGAPLGAQLRVEHRHLQRGLGHPVPLDRAPARSATACASTGPAADQPRDEEAAQHVGRRVDVLRGVERVRHRHALAPALGSPSAVGDHADEQDVARRLGAERGAERRDQRHRDATQLDAGELHRSLRTTYQPARSNPSIRPPSATSAESASRTATRQRWASAGSDARSAPMSRRYGDQRGRAVQAAGRRRAVRAGRRARPPRPRRARRPPRPMRSPPRAASTTAGSRSRQRTSSRSESSSTVDGVEHRAVEVRQVLDRLRRQLDQVEVGVAADQRVEGPGDLGDAAQQRPGALVELEREADAAAGRRAGDPGDVAVQRVLGGRVEEADARADQPAVRRTRRPRSCRPW